MGQVLHASYSGYFPFCIIEQVPPPYPFEENATFYPIGLSLEDVMLLFWRVKIWNVRGVNIATSFDKTLQVGPLVAQEENLVCTNSSYIVASDDAFDPGSGEDSFGFAFFVFEPRVILYNQLYYPSIAYDYGTSKIPTYGSMSFNSSTKALRWTDPDGNGLVEISPSIYWSYGGVY